MVVKKKTYYGGFHGFIAPVIPKAPRSLRRRSLPNKPSEGGEICAFELLAAVAGKLLQESESSTSSNSSERKEQITIPKEGDNHEQIEIKVEPTRSEHQDHGSGTESQIAGQPINLDHLKLEPPLKESPHSDNDSGLERASETYENKNGVDDIPFLGDENIEKQSGVLTAVKTYGIKEEVESCVDNHVLNKSSSRVHLSFYSDHVPRHRSNVNIDIRDDDEKYFTYNHHSNKRRVFGSRSRAGYKRIRKMLTSRYRKVAPKPKDYDTTGCGVRSFYHKRKNIYMREEHQAEKRSKSFHHCPKNANTKDSHVKFSIKSFKVPELYVEVPETATVGSLKRSVMEAVTAILQGKLHVGVVVQGKKVRDDNRTLEQTGISQKCNLETLGFTLEPSLPEPLPSKETPLLLPCNTLQHLSRSPSSPILDNNVEKNEENINLTSEVEMEDSKALVVVPPLDAVPLSEKPTKRYEFSQRRTRRPFSVSEVEALVEAVETLGAGRWRDVKMRAFDDANHRTYVDLKDKWKTLVHTASISPQQRRGEPVPQDLLDRVLAAHAYWSQHQCKHQKTV